MTSPTRCRTQESKYLQQTIQIYGLWWEQEAEYQEDEEWEEEDQETLPQAHESELTFPQVCCKAAAK